MENTKRLVTSGIAVMLAAVMVALTGAYALQGRSLTAAENEANAAVNPGGRLHDDFNGANKDVYVENFAEDGGAAIFARVRLDEYMEIGADAGQPAAEGKTAESVAEGATLSDTGSWTAYVPGAESVFDEYRGLVHGGGSTVFMPTFNKNTDSLAADINGTYDGKAGTAEHYDDYTTYTAGESLERDAVYAAESGGTETKRETHTAKPTLNGTVITMEDWLKTPEKGNYWVWDEDGWAYWANPIQPGEATGLLLDGIAPKNGAANSDMYYAINVVGQFITADDAGWKNNTGFYENDEDKPTKNAEKLLDEIGVDIGKVVVTVTAADNASTVKQGRTLQFNAAARRGAVSVEGGSYAWSLVNAPSGCSIDSKTGLLTVGSSVASGTELTVKATYTTADGDVSEGTATVTVEDGVFITVSPKSATVSAGSSRSFTATVKRGSSTVSDANITWKVSSSSCTISSSGSLNIPSSVATGTKLTVTATYNDDGTEISDTATVTVSAPAFINEIKNTTAGSSNTVTIDNTEFYVLKKDGNSAFLLAKNATGSKMSFGSSNQWQNSQIRTYLNGTWLDQHPTVKQYVKSTTIYTLQQVGSSSVYSTTDKVFLLSEADVFGTSDGSSATNSRLYTTGSKLSIPNNGILTVNGSGAAWALRSPKQDSQRISICDSPGVSGGSRHTLHYDPNYIRPALWINLS